MRSLIGPRLDALVVTHPDGDHYNEIADFLSGIEVGHVFFAGQASQYRYHGRFDRWLQAFINRNQATQPPANTHEESGSPNAFLSCPEVRIWIVAANVPASAGSASNFVNNTPSIVLRLEYHEFSAMLAADATFQTEEAILDAYDGSFLDVTLLKLGHHGSRTTSTSEEWLSAVRPEVALASTGGGDNTHGHPNGEVVLRVAEHTQRESEAHNLHWCAGPRACGTAATRESIFSTSNAGTIVVTTDGTTWRLQCERSGAC